jgi:hypothetical protein
MPTQLKHIGILTSGGDCPGLNAAIRGFGKAAEEVHGMQVTGFLDGFRGLAQDRTLPLEGRMLSGILTDGGTILGTSRDKPHKMPIGGKPIMPGCGAPARWGRSLAIERAQPCAGDAGSGRGGLDPSARRSKSSTRSTPAGTTTGSASAWAPARLRATIA